MLQTPPFHSIEGEVQFYRMLEKNMVPGFLSNAQSHVPRRGQCYCSFGGASNSR
jgi:hypothetical protein